MASQNTLSTIPYEIYKNNNAKSTAFGRYFARPATRGTVGIEELCEHIASHGSSFDRATIQGVVITLVDCIPELLSMGYKVKLGSLGTFYNTFTSVKNGAEKPADFDPAKHIKGVNLRFLPNATKVLNGKYDNTSTTRAKRHGFILFGGKKVAENTAE